MLEKSRFITGSGNPQYIIAQKLKTLKGNLKVLNFEDFGQLKRNIKDVKKFVLATQSAYDSNPSDQLLLDLNSGKFALRNWHNAKSAHWKQKENVRWLHAGDRNTKKFHLSAKSRSICNRFDKIYAEGSLLEDEEEIRDYARLHFSQLLQSPIPF